MIHRINSTLKDFLAIENGNEKPVVEDDGFNKNDLVYILYYEEDLRLKWLLCRRIVEVHRNIPHIDAGCCALELV